MKTPILTSSCTPFLADSSDLKEEGKRKALHCPYACRMILPFQFHNKCSPQGTPNNRACSLKRLPCIECWYPASFGLLCCKRCVTPVGRDS